MDVFLSYSHRDHKFAAKMAKSLIFFGIDLWMDERLKPGVKFEAEIQQQLKNALVCIFLLSESFLESEYCQNEVGFAEGNNKKFFPIKIKIVI